MAYTISDEERARRAQRLSEMRARKKVADSGDGNGRMDVHRFALPDLEDTGAWLVERLKAKWAHLTDKTVAAWLRGVMESNEFLFVRTRNAVALAQASHAPLEPVPFIEEIFVFVRDGANDEAVQLYTAMRNWAEGLGASRVEVGNMTDVEPEDVAAAFNGKLETRIQPFAQVRGFRA